MAVGREPGGQATDHRALPQRDRTTGPRNGEWAWRARGKGDGVQSRATGSGRRDRAKGAWRGVHGHGTMRRDGDIAPYRNGTAPRDRAMGMGERDRATGHRHGRCGGAQGTRNYVSVSAEIRFSYQESQKKSPASTSSKYP